MRSIVVWLVACLLLAGCAENGGGQEGPDGSGSPEVTGNGTAEPPVAGLQPLVLDVQVVNGTVLAGEPVLAQVQAEGGALPNATWTARLLVANGTSGGNDTLAAQEGTGLPAQLNLTTDRVGNLTLVVQASAPGFANATATAAVAVVEATVAATPPPDPVIVRGTSTLGHPAHSQICLRDGIDGNKHSVAPAQVGWSYKLTSGYAVYWWNGSSYVSGGGATVNGTDAEVCDTSGAGGTYTLTMWHPEAPEP